MSERVSGTGGRSPSRCGWIAIGAKLLQELRVIGTGVQILFAFLLGIAFHGSCGLVEAVGLHLKEDLPALLALAAQWDQRLAMIKRLAEAAHGWGSSRTSPARSLRGLNRAVSWRGAGRRRWRYTVVFRAVTFPVDADVDRGADDPRPAETMGKNGHLEPPHLGGIPGSEDALRWMRPPP